MRVLVCGGRSFDDPEYLNQELDRIAKARPFTLLMHGCARGADTQAGDWAAWRGIAVQRYPAMWKVYGNRKAGPIRNSQMLQEGKPDLVIAFPGGRGTDDMIKKAEAAGVEVIRIPKR